MGAAKLERAEGVGSPGRALGIGTLDLTTRQAGPARARRICF